MTARTTRIAMIVLGLALWLLAIAWPGWQWPIMLLGVALVMAGVFGLMVDKPENLERFWNGEMGKDGKPAGR